MWSSPPASAWFVLGLLSALITREHLAHARRDRRRTAAPSAVPAISEIEGMRVALACAVPGALAVVTGAPWESWVWWQIAGVAAAVVVLTTVASVRLVARYRDQFGRMPPSERVATRVVVGVTFAGALAVPVALVLLWWVAELDVRTSLATGLAFDYALWIIAYAMARRSTTVADVG